MCLGRRYESIDMQHDLFGLGHDLDLRSNFQHDFSMSNYTSLDASRQEKHDAGKIKSCVFTESKVMTEKRFSQKKTLFLEFLLSRGQTVEIRQHLRTCWRKNCKRAIECAFFQLWSSSGSRVMCRFVEKC